MPHTILIVDDDADFRSALAAVLTRAAYRVLEATDGAEALEVLSAESPKVDAIVVDLVLPKVSGVELVGAIAQRQTVVKILATSSILKVVLQKRLSNRTAPAAWRP